jgi:hypothetical protein
MKNRHGIEYSFVKVSDNLYRFDMAEEGMDYMRIGGKEGQSGIDYNDLGMFDPSGGPYVAIGERIFWDEIQGATAHSPLTVKRIYKENSFFVEVV